MFVRKGRRIVHCSSASGLLPKMSKRSRDGPRKDLQDEVMRSPGIRDLISRVPSVPGVPSHYGEVSQIHTFEELTGTLSGMSYLDCRRRSIINAMLVCWSVRASQ